MSITKSFNRIVSALLALTMLLSPMAQPAMAANNRAAGTEAAFSLSVEGFTSGSSTFELPQLTGGSPTEFGLVLGMEGRLESVGSYVVDIAYDSSLFTYTGSFDEVLGGIYAVNGQHDSGGGAAIRVAYLAEEILGPAALEGGLISLGFSVNQGAAAGAEAAFGITVTEMFDNQAAAMELPEAGGCSARIIPAPPAGLTVSAPNYHSAVIGWDAAVDSSGAVSAYRILRNGEELTTISSDGSIAYSYTDDTAIPGRTYNYSVLAMMDGLAGYDAGGIDITMQDADAPELEYSRLSGSSIELGWQELKNIEGYAVFMRAAGEPGYTLYREIEGAGSTAAVIDGLSGESDYLFTVSAYYSDNSGARAYGDRLEEGIAVFLESRQPLELQAERSGFGAVKLSWYPVDGGAAAEYQVWRSSGSEWAFAASVPPGGLDAEGRMTYTDAAILPGSEYRYRIQAYSESGELLLTGAEAAFTAYSTDLPKDLVADIPDAGSAVLSWGAAASGAGSLERADGYLLYRTANGNTHSTALISDIPQADGADGSFSFTDEGLRQGVRYTYELRPYITGDGGGRSLGESAFVEVLIPSLEAVSGLSAAASPDGGTLISFAEHTHEHTGGYYIERRVLNSPDWERIVDMPTGMTSHADGTASPGTEYEYRVQAYALIPLSIGGYSRPIPGEFSLPVQTVAPLGRVGGLTAEPFSADGIRIGFEAADDADGYILLRNGEQIAALPRSGSSFLHEDTGIDPALYGEDGIVYTVTGYKLHNGSRMMGISQSTEPVRIPYASLAVSGLKAVSSDGAVEISWEPVEGANYYEYYAVPEGDSSAQPVMVEDGCRALLRAEPDTEYRISVRASSFIDGSGGAAFHGPVSGSISYTMGSAAIKVSAPVVEGDGHLTFSWDTISGMDWYTISRKSYLSHTDSYQKIAVLPADGGTTMTYTDTGTQKNSIYSYRGQGYSYADGVYRYSKPGETALQTVIRASEPTSVGAVSIAGSNAIRVYWTHTDAAPEGYQYRYSVSRMQPGASDGEDFAELALTDGSEYTDTTATAGATYLYSVRSVLVKGDIAIRSNAKLASQYAKAGDGMAELSGLAYDISGPGSIRLSWANNGASRYNVYRDGTLLASVSDAEYLDDTAVQGEEYEYTVTALYLDGKEALPGCSTSAAIPLLDAPAGASVGYSANGGGALEISWQPAAGADGYIITRSGGPGAEAEFMADSSPFTDTGAEEGVSYRYTVCGYIISGGGAIIPGRAAAASARLDAPELTCSTVDAQSVRLSWQPVYGAESYTLTRSGGQPFSVTVEGECTRLDTGLKAGTEYIYSLTAVSGRLSSQPTQMSYSLPSPAAPTDVKATESDGSVTLSWSGAHSAPFGYAVFRDGETAPRARIAGSGGECSYTDTPVMPDTDHTYTVRSYFVCGDGSLIYGGGSSAAITSGSLSAPAWLTAEPISGGGIELSWPGVARAGEYRIQRDGETIGAVTASAGMDKYAFTDPSPIQDGAAHSYAVTAILQSGGTSHTGAATEAAVTLAAMPQVTLTDAALAPDDATSAVLTWDAVAQSSGSPSIEGYCILYSAGGDFVPAAWVKGLGMTSCRIGGLSANSEYSFKAVAYYRAPNGAAMPADHSGTNVLKVTTGLPGAPLGITAEVLGAAAISISYDEVSGAEGYNIYRRELAKPSSRPQKITCKTSEYIDVKVRQGVEYSYEIAALTAYGEGSLSEPVSCAIPAIPAPALTAVQGDGHTVKLEWDAVSPSHGSYDIHYEILRDRVAIERDIFRSGGSRSASDTDTQPKKRYSYTVTPYILSPEGGRIYGKASRAVSITTGSADAVRVEITSSPVAQANSTMTPAATAYSPFGKTDQKISWSILAHSGLSSAPTLDSRGRLVIGGTLNGQGSITLLAQAADSSGEPTAQATADIEVYDSYLAIRDGEYQVAAGKRIAIPFDSIGRFTRKWSVDDTSLATISSSGQLTAKKQAGLVTVTLTGGGHTDSCTVRILPAATGVEILHDAKVIGRTGTSASTVSMDMTQSPTVQLSAGILGEGAMGGVSWKSSSQAVASIDESGLLTLYKPGTSTITATAADGSGKSASFRLNVTYLDPSRRFTAAIEGASKLGVGTGGSARMLILNERGSEMDASLFTFSVPDNKKHILTVDESGMLSAGHTTGSATVTAMLSGDPLKRKATLNVKVVEPHISTLRLEPEGLDSFEFDEAGSLLLERSALEYAFDIRPVALDAAGSALPIGTGLRLETRPAGAADVTMRQDGIISVRIGSDSSAGFTISAVSADRLKAEASIEVIIKDYAPVPGTDTFTLNTNMSPAAASTRLTSRYGNDILSVSVSGSEGYSAAHEDGILTLRHDGFDPPADGQKLLLRVETVKGWHEFPISVQTVSSMPKVKLTQDDRFNLFYTDGEAGADIHVSSEGNARIARVLLRGGDFIAESTDISEDGRSAQVRVGYGYDPVEKGAKYRPAAKLAYEVWFEDHNRPVSGTFTLKTASTKPALALSSTRSTINTAYGDPTAALSILSDKKTGEILDIGEQDVTVSQGVARGSVNPELDQIALSLTGTRGGSVTITVRKQNWVSPIELRHSISVNTSRPTVRLSSSMMTLNSRFADVSSASSRLTVSQSNIGIGSVSFKATDKKQAALAEAGKLQLSFNRRTGSIAVSIRDGENVAPGTYGFTAAVTLRDSVSNSTVTTQNLTFRVKVTDTLPRASLASSTLKLNLALLQTEGNDERAMSAFRMTAKEYTVTGVNVKSCSSTMMQDALDFSIDGTGALVVSYNESGGRQAALDAGKGSYTYQIAPVVSMGSSKGVELAPIRCTVQLYSAVPFSAAAGGSGRLSASQGGSVIYTLNRLTNISGKVEDIYLTGKDAGLFDIVLTGVNARGQYTANLTQRAGHTYNTRLNYEIELNYVLEGMSATARTNTIRLRISA